MSGSVKIVPRIKVNYGHSLYSGDKDRVFLGNPLPAGIDIPHDQQPIMKVLFEDIMLCFAIDKGDNYELLKNNIYQNNPNLNENILTELSKNALIAEIGGKIKLNGDPGHFVMITAGGNFEAALILIEDFWEQMHRVFGGDIVFAVPAKDLLFLVKKDNQPSISKLKELVKGYFDRPDTQGLLSKGLFLKTPASMEMKLIDKAF